MQWNIEWKGGWFHVCVCLINPGRKHCRVVAETGVCSMCRLEYGICLKRKRQAKSCRKVNSHLAQLRVCVR